MERNFNVVFSINIFEFVNDVVYFSAMGIKATAIERATFITNSDSVSVCVCDRLCVWVWMTFICIYLAGKTKIWDLPPFHCLFGHFGFSLLYIWRVYVGSSVAWHINNNYLVFIIAHLVLLWQ